jgi:hypothetical protein
MASTTYSFTAVTAAFNHPLAGSYVMQGQQGFGQIVISNATERTVHDVAADGGIMVSYIPGDNGSVEIEMQQTNAFHEFLVGWYNLIKTNADNGDLSNWATATFVVRDMLSGALHTLTGVSPQKVPDKTYADRGGRIRWVLMAAQVIQE